MVPPETVGPPRSLSAEQFRLVHSGPSEVAFQDRGLLALTRPSPVFEYVYEKLTVGVGTRIERAEVETMTEVLGTDLDGQGFGDLLEAAATLLAEIAPRAVDPGFLDALPPVLTPAADQDWGVYSADTQPRLTRPRSCRRSGRCWPKL